MPRGQRDKQREQQKKERQRQQRTAVEPAGAPARDPAAAELASQLAEQLGEREPEPLGQLERLVAHMGRERALALLAETMAIEAQGGQLVPSEGRRRTPGGVFFKLAGKLLSKPERMAIFFPEHESVTVLSEAELAGFLADRAQWPRAAPRRAKLQISGRPARIPPADVPANTPYVVLSMVGRAALPQDLPHGPPPIAGATTFRVLAPTARWRSLAPRLIERPDVELFVIGTPALSAKRPDVVTVRASLILLRPAPAAAPDDRLT